MNSRLHLTPRVFLFILLTLFLAVMFLSGPAGAADTVAIREIDTLAAGQTIHGMGFFTGNLVRVDGTVEGTTFATGQEVRINGIINGDLFTAAQTITIAGKVNGNIYMAGKDLELGTQTDGDVFAAGQTILVPAHGVIGRDLMAAGQSITLEGTVQRHLNGGAVEMVLGGTVGQDAVLEANDIQLLPGASIGGDLTYKSEKQAAISPGAKVVGQIDWEQVASQPPMQPPMQAQKDPYKMIWRILLRIAGALLVWFIIRIWWPDLWNNVSQSLLDHPLKTLGVGVLVLLVTPLLMILLMVTVIGIPLGLILGTLYGLSFYLSKIIVAVFLANWATRRFGWKEYHMGVWLVLLELTILVLLTQIPYAGMLIRLLITLAGMGAIFLSKYKGTKEAVQ